MKKERVNYELKKVDKTIVLTIGNIAERRYSKFYFILSKRENKVDELAQNIYNTMLEYESEREKIIKGKRAFIRNLFEIIYKGGD